MKIVEYDTVDPISVFNVTMLALGFALTPEHAEHIRCTDPRPFPRLSVCAVEDDVVIGHVGVFRLPMISTEGREDVGGIWAVSTHPEHARRGVASLLVEEAHARMQSVGLRFSTLGTDRIRVAHKLYRQQRNFIAPAYVERIPAVFSPWPPYHSQEASDERQQSNRTELLAHHGYQDQI